MLRIYFLPTFLMRKVKKTGDISKFANLNVYDGFCISQRVKTKYKYLLFELFLQNRG